MRVQYAETDKIHVASYYANHFVWFEVGRRQLPRSLGRSACELEAAGLMLPGSDTQYESLRSARSDDDVTILIHQGSMWPVRVRVDGDAQRPADQVVTTVAHTVHAAVHREGCPNQLPTQIREVRA